MPTAIDGPRVVLNIRDYLKASPVALPVKKCFLHHAYTWMNSKIAALGVFKQTRTYLEKPSGHQI